MCRGDEEEKKLRTEAFNGGMGWKRAEGSEVGEGETREGRWGKAAPPACACTHHHGSRELSCMDAISGVLRGKPLRRDGLHIGPAFADTGLRDLGEQIAGNRQACAEKGVARCMGELA